MSLLYQHNVEIFIPIISKCGEQEARGGLTNIPIIGRVDAGTPVLDEENLEGYLEIDRLGGDRSNLFVLRVKGDLVSDLRERQLWRTPEWPPASVRPWEACL
jgi:SOS-response transcriptional repressor LexA